jgi:hypothetical protein
MEARIRKIREPEAPLWARVDLYPVLGVKKMDYNDFRNIYNIILSKGHLSPEGLAQIQQIRNNMNDKRTVF